MAYDFEPTAGDVLARHAFLAPATDEVRVLLFDSAVWAGYVDSAERLLDSGERARASRFRFEHDREAYILSHALWRVALGICLGVGARRVPLTSTSSGQPRLPGTGLATSLSGTGGWSAIAIAGADTVGVDIERSPARIALEELIPTMCTLAERNELAKLSTRAREPVLLDMWTRKEALLKAFGVGLLEDPALLSASTSELISPPASAPVQIPCRVRNLDLPIALTGALAVPASVHTLRIYLLDDSPRG
jgi:4'-phosphopantetheinyl transferase